MAMVKIGCTLGYLRSLSIGDKCTLEYPDSKTGEPVTRSGEVVNLGKLGKQGPWVKIETLRGPRTFSFCNVDSCSVEEGSMTMEQISRFYEV